MVRGVVLFESPANPREVALEPGRYVSRRQGREGGFVVATLKGQDPGGGGRMHGQ